uniref:Uncharacterized protein n=1 Tax=Romanomermis culicivorax TaxID=13658 RepID=A0A915ILD4_ROMCU
MVDLLRWSTYWNSRPSDPVYERTSLPVLEIFCAPPFTFPTISPITLPDNLGASPKSFSYEIFSTCFSPLVRPLPLKFEELVAPGPKKVARPPEFTPPLHDIIDHSSPEKPSADI